MNATAQNTISHWTYPALKDYRPKQYAAPEEVIKLVCKTFEVTFEDLKAKTRKQPIAVIRQIACNMLFKFTSLSLAKIGWYFTMDHSTVLHANKCVRNMRYTRDKMFFNSIINIETSLSEKYYIYDGRN